MTSRGTAKVDPSESAGFPIKLVCLPFAGGSSTTFLAWKKWLDKRIECVPIELAGRRNRQNDALYADMEEAVRDVRGIVEREIRGSAYALFGHSMGTVIVYELLRAFAADNSAMPVHVFFSGRFPPFIETEKTAYHALPDSEFIAMMEKFGGDAGGLFRNEEIVRLILPILKNDYKLVETYRHTGKKLSLDCPITIFGGTRDSIVPGSDLQLWRECTTAGSSYYEFDDGHFFINSRREEIVAIVNNRLIGPS